MGEAAEHVGWQSWDQQGGSAGEPGRQDGGTAGASGRSHGLLCWLCSSDTEAACHLL